MDVLDWVYTLFLIALVVIGLSGLLDYALENPTDHVSVEATCFAGRAVIPCTL